MPGEVRAGGQVGLGRRRRKRHMHGQAPTKGLGAVRARLRGAHPKHPVHVRDLGRVEAQRLIERPRLLSSHREGIRCRAWCGLADRWAWGGGGPSGTRGEGPRLKARVPSTHARSER